MKRTFLVAALLVGVVLFVSSAVYAYGNSPLSQSVTSLGKGFQESAAQIKDDNKACRQAVRDDKTLKPSERAKKYRDCYTAYKKAKEDLTLELKNAFNSYILDYQNELKAAKAIKPRTKDARKQISAANKKIQALNGDYGYFYYKINPRPTYEDTGVYTGN